MAAEPVELHKLKVPAGPAPPPPGRSRAVDPRQHSGGPGPMGSGSSRRLWVVTGPGAAPPAAGPCGRPRLGVRWGLVGPGGARWGPVPGLGRARRHPGLCAEPPPPPGAGAAPRCSPRAVRGPAPCPEAARGRSAPPGPGEQRGQPGRLQQRRGWGWGLSVRGC